MEYSFHGIGIIKNKSVLSQPSAYMLGFVYKID